MNDDLEDEMDESTSLYYEGRELLKLKRYAEARDVLMRSRNLQAHSKTSLLIGQCYAALGDKDGAYDMYSESYRLGPQTDQAALAFAEALLERGEVSEAEQIAKQILKRQPTYGGAIRLLSKLKSG